MSKMGNNPSGHLLIVDDEKAMCELIDTAMSMRGYETAWCLSADDAMSLIKENDFDVVLTDVKMPGTSGLQLCQQISQLRPDIPVVVMTAFGTLETAVAAIRSGAYDFITKPVELEVLALTIARAVERCGQSVAALKQARRDVIAALEQPRDGEGDRISMALQPRFQRRRDHCR